MRLPRVIPQKFSRWPLIGAAALFTLCAAAFAALWIITPDPLPAVTSWPVSPVLLDKDGRLVHARLSRNQEWCLPIPLSEMGAWLPKTLVAVEDKRFYSHHGIDFLALGRAIVHNVASGRVRSGASTISSQLVRLSTPRARTISTKALEFMGALKLERSLSKEEILEHYLNRAPFGGPIRGVEAAARLYFGKRARELSLGEASLLVGLLKGPTAYRPDRNPQAALQRRQRIIAKVAAQAGFPKDLTALALEDPLPLFRPAMPDSARHFADLVFKTLPPDGGVARSTLDPRAQTLLENALEERLRLTGEDVTAAGIVVDNRTASIIAYVGNARFNPERNSQWVDCALAPRSPGSTLKPFLYLAALEQGHIIPATLLADTPLQLGGAAPRNFDRRYRGPVTAHAALAESLNTPAVRVLRMLGVRESLHRLRKAGFAFLNRDDAVYGDSLVLGAGEVTLLELARAYTTLASLGTDRPLLIRRAATDAAGGQHTSGSSPARRSSGFAALEAHQSGGNITEATERSWSKVPLLPLPGGLAPLPVQLAAASRTGRLPAPRQLYSAAASFLIADILKDPGRLPFLVQLVQAREQSPVAFKTGTSFGLRDAWTAAYCPAYTVAVWFGRAGGGPDPRLLGISLAAPAAIKMLRSLTAGTPPDSSWYAPPAGVGRETVCTLSGASPSPFCPSTRQAWIVPAVRRTVPCDMHVLRDGKNVLIWPPELEDFNRKRFAAEDLSRSALIVSPMPGARYLITPGAKQQPIPLKAEGVAYPVYWYVNGEYLGAQEREDLPLYWLPAGGEHSLSLLDARERIAAATVQVTDLGAKRDPPLSLLSE